MSEEIKEILDNLIINETTGMCYLSIRLTNQTRNIITNLQQENEKLKYNARGQVNDYFKDKYADEVLKSAELKKENEKEKQFIKDCGFQNQQQLVLAYLDYKSRCQKAIEYIENNKKETSSHFNGKEYVYRNFTLCCEPNDLLNILNGSDEE